MPADQSSYNQHNFRTACGSLSVPYPSAEEAFRLSNTHAPVNDFSSLGLSNFFIAHQWVAHHHLDHLSLSGNTQELLSQGVQVGLVRIYSWYPQLHALFPFSFPCTTTPWPEHIVKLLMMQPLHYAYPHREGYVVLVCHQYTPKGLRTTSCNSWTWIKSHKGDKRLTQGPLLLEDDDRRLRLPTTKEDIVLNLWIHIPFWVIDCFPCFQIVITPFTFFSNYLLLSGRGLSTRTQRNHRYQEDSDKEEGTCQEIGLVAFMFFFELLFSICSSQFPSMFPLLTYS